MENTEPTQPAPVQVTRAELQARATELRELATELALCEEFKAGAHWQTRALDLRGRLAEMRKRYDIQAEDLQLFEADLAQTPLLELLFGTREDSPSRLGGKFPSRPRGTLYANNGEGYSGFWDVDNSNLGYSQLQDTFEGTRADLEAGLAQGTQYVFVPDDCGGSDYGGGGALTRSNCQALAELCDGVNAHADSEGGSARYWKLHGGHGSYGIAIDVTARSTELVDCLERLSDYPVIDESLMSEMESEEESEAWSDCYRADFRKEIAEREEMDLDAVPDAELDTLFYDVMSNGGESWEHDSSGASIRLERITKAITRAEVLALSGVARADEQKQMDALVRYGNALPLWAELVEQVATPPMERAHLADNIARVREALGAPNLEALGLVEGYLAEIAGSWPLSATRTVDSDPTVELQTIRAELATLRSQAGIVIRGAREYLLALAPDRYAREFEKQARYGRDGFPPLPEETPPKRA